MAAAAAAASAAAISSVSLTRGHHHLPAKPSIFSFSFNLSSQKVLPLFRPRPNSAPTSLPSKIRASDDVDVDDDVDDNDSESSFSDELDPDSEIPYESSIPPEDYDSMLYSDDLPESEEDIAAAYEELYGPAFSGTSVLGNDVFVEDARRNRETELGLVMTEGKKDDTFEERLVQVRRVTKVVTGGKQLRFRAIVIIGDKQGCVEVGVGKGTADAADHLRAG